MKQWIHVEEFDGDRCSVIYSNSIAVSSKRIVDCANDSHKWFVPCGDDKRCPRCHKARAVTRKKVTETEAREVLK